MLSQLEADGHSAAGRDDTEPPSMGRSRITDKYQSPDGSLASGSPANRMRDDVLLGSQKREGRAAPRGCGDPAGLLV